MVVILKYRITLMIQHHIKFIAETLVFLYAWYSYNLVSLMILWKYF